MQITLEKDSLLEAVASAQHVVERRHTVPILAHLLFEAGGDRISITATDIETTLRIHIDAAADKPGSTTVQARKLFEILKELAEERVTLEALDGFVSLRSGASRFRLHSLPAEEFPSFAEEETDAEISIEGALLASMIGGAVYAASNDETRRYLTGVLFETKAYELRLVATDGHRLALRSSAGVHYATERQCIVPRKAVQEIRRLAEKEDKVRLFLGERQLRLKGRNFLFACRLIDAKFPDYEEVVPSGYSDVAILPKEDFDRALRRAMVVASEFPHTVELSFSEQGIDLSARNFEQEEVQDRIKAEYRGRSKRFGFNARYLRDALAAIEAERVCFEIGEDEGMPALLYGEGSEGERHVVMPMRL